VSELRCRRRACDVAGREIDRVSGCVFVFVDQPAEQVGAI
jgi:hypothetical protein